MQFKFMGNPEKGCANTLNGYSQGYGVITDAFMERFWYVVFMMKFYNDSDDDDIPHMQHVCVQKSRWNSIQTVVKIMKPLRQAQLRAAERVYKPFASGYYEVLRDTQFPTGASDRSASGGSSPSKPPVWKCPKCTLDNRKYSQKCAACKHKRPALVISKKRKSRK